MLFRLITLVCFGAIAFLGMFLLTELGIVWTGRHLTDAQWFAVVVSVIISAHLVLLIHELGHVIGGWLAGYRLRELTVGLVTVERRGERLRLGLNHRLRHYGGLVQMIPGESDESKGRTVLLLLLGPAASLLVGAVITLAGLRWLADATTLEPTLGGVLLTRQVAVVGVGSVVVGLANLVPVTFYGRKSDGAELWEQMQRLDD